MSRNFIPDETLIDRLLLNDTEAFEELHHRYCYPLYAYCITKLDAPEDARNIVRDIFIRLWENRKTLPVGFSISLHLYSEVRHSVLCCLNEKLITQTDIPLIEKQVVPGFAVSKLQEARQPVKKAKRVMTTPAEKAESKKKVEQPWWNYYPSENSLRSLRNMRLALNKVLHLF